MIGHLFQLAWNRRRANALILAEILVSFLVLCALLTGATWFALHWIQPRGFEYENVWQVEMRRPRGETTRREGAEFTDTLKRLLADAEAFPQVEAAALMANAPYSGGTTSNVTWVGGGNITILHTPITPGGFDVLRLKLLAGRWLEPADDALDWQPVVLSQALARKYFGAADPLGKDLPAFNDDGTPATPDPDSPRSRIVGVVADVRRDGELAPTPFMLFARPELKRETFNTPDVLLVRVRPGTPAAFEETLARSLQATAPDWSFKLDPLARERASALRAVFVPVALAGLVVLFLLLMVGMGLIGVLWQGVARRTSEIGVRRALGATAAGVLVQIVGELLALTTLAVIAGSLLFVQLPILQLVKVVPPGVFLLGLVEAWVVIYLFVTACGLYPGWLATRVEPARALQHE